VDIIGNMMLTYSLIKFIDMPLFTLYVALCWNVCEGLVILYKLCMCWCIWIVIFTINGTNNIKYMSWSIHSNKIQQNLGRTDSDIGWFKYASIRSLVMEMVSLKTLVNLNQPPDAAFTSGIFYCMRNVLHSEGTEFRSLICICV
jgi:hypothetical protein